MNRALSRKMHEAKARKRMAEPAPDYPPAVDYERLACRITVESFDINGHAEAHVVELFPARGGRRDQYRALVNGELWRESISRSKVYEGLRKAR